MLRIIGLQDTAINACRLDQDLLEEVVCQLHRVGFEETVSIEREAVCVLCLQFRPLANAQQVVDLGLVWVHSVMQTSSLAWQR